MRIIILLLLTILGLYFLYSKTGNDNGFLRNTLKTAILFLTIIFVVIVVSAFLGNSI